MESTPIRRALLSVSDKTGLIEFAGGLRSFGIEIVSTGGTARALREAGIPIVDIEAFTGFPEILDGRVKTLHPRVHAGILHRRDVPDDVETLKAHGFGPIDLVAVNLYPFEATVARAGVSRDEAVERIDIGGPSMIRSAAKNHVFVTVVVSPAQYGEVLASLGANRVATTLALRERLAREAFRHTAAYDIAIAGYLEREGGSKEAGGAASLPESFMLSLPRARVLRYGENPHQAAALYGRFLDRFRQLHGKELSYNNILDLAAAEELAEILGRRGPAVVIVKHTNPCGAAVGETVESAWKKALLTDPQAASGGIIAASRPVDGAAAEAIKEHFIEILAAPAFEKEALDLLLAKKNRILLEALGPTPGARQALAYRSVPDGALVQTPDDRTLRDEDLRLVTRRAPTGAERAALCFAWDVVRFVKSNAIVFAAADRTLGIGAGQMSRVDAVRIAALKAEAAGIDLHGSAVASDAFFPFPDGLLAAAGAGATAAIQPGGSVRDKEVIAAADERGIAMLFTGVRHFRH